jgi:hypothetical protein
MRVLKRPMFRKGGSTGQGVMTGLVDRTKYAVGDRAKELSEEYKDILGKPDISELLITGGLNLVGGQGTGRGTLADIATAYQKPTQELLGDIKARNLAAKKMGIEQAQAEELKKFSGSQLTNRKKAQVNLRAKGIELTEENINKETARLNKLDETGKALSPDRIFQSAVADYRGIYGEGNKAYTHAAFDVKVAPKLRQDGKNPKGKIPVDSKGEYKTKRLRPGVYIDVENRRIVEFDGQKVIRLEEYEKDLK